MKDKKEQNLDIELTEEVAQGIYSNLAMIGHSASEFAVDFIQILPGLNKAKVRSRIIVTPEHAKRLAVALAENIQKYEERFGSIQIKEEQNNQINMVGFGNNAGEA